MATKYDIFLFTIIVILNQLTEVQSTVKNFDGFKRLQILDGYACSSNDTIKVESVQNTFQCLLICSKLTSCNGVFITPASSLICAMCSTKFFSINVALQINSTGEFYKRTGNTGDISEVAVFSLVPAANWSNAEESCVSYGGHLAKIISNEENEYVSNVTLASQQYGVWLGGSGITGMVNTFKWWDGSRLVDGYANWAPGQPWSKETGLMCIVLYMSANGRWGDEQCSEGKANLCKFD